MADYIYVCAGGLDDSLTIIDVTNPAAPTLAGNIRGAGAPNFLNEPHDIFIRGNYAYVVSSNDFSLTIINISNPAAPFLAGSIQGPGGPPLYMAQPHGIFVLGDYAYVAAFVDNALTIFNISDPAAPFHVGAIINGGIAHLLGAERVYVRGNYAYVAAHQSDALTIIDVSNPALPVAVGFILGAGAPPGGNWLDGPYDIFVKGDYAYIPALNDDALTIINISNPLAPAFAGSIQGGAGPPWLGGAQGVWVVGNYAYIAARTDDALTIIDISNPAAPFLAGSIQGPGGPNWLNGAWEVIVDGDYAYVTALGDDALSIFNISNPAAPFHVTTIRGAGVPPGGNWLQFPYGLAGKFIHLPTVTTDPATDVAANSATLNGTLDDDGLEACDCGFEWGETVAYGNTTPTQSRTTGQTFSQPIVGLIPGTTYHFRAFATNSEGAAYGADRTFTPVILIPTVTTEPATLISQVSATLNGILNDDGGEACDCGFEWGLTPAYGHTTLTESKVTGESFSQAIGGLTPGTTYHFRAFATNSAGTGYGADRTFTSTPTFNRAHALSREEL